MEPSRSTMGAPVTRLPEAKVQMGAPEASNAMRSPAYVVAKTFPFAAMAGVKTVPVVGADQR
jgi:hypothetical protein